MKLYHSIVTIILALSICILQFSFCTTQVGPEPTLELNNDGNIQIADGPVLRGNKLTMYVVALSDYPKYFQWYKDNDTIEGAVDYKYTIDSLTVEHEGIYRCEVSSKSASVYSEPYKLEIIKKTQEVLINYSGMVFSSGEINFAKPFFLYIKPNKNLALSYQWYKNDKKIENAKKDTLHFEALSYINRGNFYCKVIYKDRIVKSLNYIIDFKNSPPVWIHDSMNVKLDAGDLLKLTLKDSCNDIDNDSLVFTLLDGKPENDIISDKGMYQFLSSPEDSGIYHVRIKASDGKVESTGVFKITVHYKIKEKEIPLLDNNGIVLSSSVPQSGNPFFLYVTPNSNLSLTYQWYRNDKIIEQATDDTLWFGAVSNTHVGNYFCEVKYDNQTVKSLVYKLEIGNNPPKWKNEIMNVKISAGTSLKLSLNDSCSDGDNDPLTFSLVPGKPDGDLISNQGIYEYQSNIEDKGEYSVIIQASDGNVSSNGIVRISVHQKNQPPEFRDSLPHDSYKLNEGDNLTIRFEVTDKNNDRVTYNLSKNSLPRPETAIFDTASKTLTWTSKKGDKGGYTIAIQASDGKLTTEKVMEIGIGEINLPPKISISNVNQQGTVYITENETLEFTATISDPNSKDKPTFNEPKNLPKGATFDRSSGKFRYKPQYDVSTESSNKSFKNITFHALDNAAQNPLPAEFVFHINVRDKKFLITAESDEGGSIDPSGTIKAEPGKDYEFTITPKERWKIKDVVVNGENKGAVTTHQFKKVKEDNTIRVIFEKHTLTLTISSDKNGKTAPQGNIEVKSNTTTIVTVNPKKGYVFKQWETSKGNPGIKKLSDNKFEIQVKEESVKLKALFKKQFQARAVETGGNHSFFLKGDNTLWAAGRNKSGQLGDGTTDDRNSPKQVFTDVTSVICGKNSTFVIRNDKTLWATGKNDHGQLGLGSTDDQKSFTKIHDIKNIKGISIGPKHTMIIKHDGTLWGAGHPDYIGLGDSKGNILNFTKIPEMKDVIKVCTGESFTIALKSNNTIWSVGKDNFGALGLVFIKECEQFTLVPHIGNVADIAAGSNSTYILKNDNVLWAFGRNEEGQLGNGTFSNMNLPVEIMNNVRAVSACDYYALILRMDNTLWATGKNEHGQFGIGSTKSTDTPIKILDNVISAKAGDDHSIIIKKDGSVCTAGRNKNGQLGLGDKKDRSIYTAISSKL